jgi:hypothetical protein
MSKAAGVADSRTVALIIHTSVNILRASSGFVALQPVASRCVRGKLQRNRERITVRGLNDNRSKL